MRRILCVDDDPNILSVFETALRQKGYQVFVTSDPMEVASLLEKQDIDLVMLDVCMPKKDGFQIFTEVKKKYGGLPILFATAYPRSFDMQSNEMIRMWTEGFADGITDIMYKPFDVNTLYQKVEALIDGAEGGKE